MGVAGSSRGRQLQLHQAGQHPSMPQGSPQRCPGPTDAGGTAGGPGVDAARRSTQVPGEEAAGSEQAGQEDLDPGATPNASFPYSSVPATKMASPPAASLQQGHSPHVQMTSSGPPTKPTSLLREKGDKAPPWPPPPGTAIRHQSVPPYQLEDEFLDPQNPLKRGEGAPIAKDEGQSAPPPLAEGGRLQLLPALPQSPPATGAQIWRNSLTSSPSRDPGDRRLRAAAAAGPARGCECGCERGKALRPADTRAPQTLTRRAGARPLRRCSCGALGGGGPAEPGHPPGAPPALPGPPALLTRRGPGPVATAHSTAGGKLAAGRAARDAERPPAPARPRTPPRRDPPPRVDPPPSGPSPLTPCSLAPRSIAGNP
ncbi:basic proline-rich protein-like [Sciurus carolinensis]|uniref:basic proline-rich protein-like n=1 Tax=Sciurus carolinensis TaxID=30640 RepID=UPI001FB3DDF0|nr:basic proline-rich protein-like [Sciurus carolinensis]